MELNKFPNYFESTQFKKIIDKDELSNLIDSLAHTINGKYDGEELVIVSILKGSLKIVSELSKRLTSVKAYYEFVSIESHGKSDDSEGTISLKKDISSNIRGKNILIVEDIIDNATSLNFLIKRLELSGAQNIEILTLLDKPYKRAYPIKPDYIGKQLSDKFVIGFGLDLHEYGRNLDEIYTLEFPN